MLEAGRAVWYESLQKKDVGKTGLQSIFFYNDPYFVGRAACGFWANLQLSSHVVNPFVKACVSRSVAFLEQFCNGIF